MINFLRFTGGLVAFGVLFAACAGGNVSTFGPSTALRHPFDYAQAHMDRDRRGSWMSPDATSEDLLYISDQIEMELWVFSYPEGAFVGEIAGVNDPQGLCVDKQGDVFVPEFSSGEILEYAHGGTSPIATLTNPGEYMEGCSVDTKTGNLAVINYSTPSNGPGGVSIYAKATGNPTVYTDSALAFGYQLGYDNASNLFLDGLDSSHKFEFAELPKGSSSFTEINLNASIGTPGGVQWDGKYVAVGDATGGKIYQTNGAGGQIEGTTSLSGSDGIFQFFIERSKVKRRVRVIGPNALATTSDSTTDFWRYPRGGEPKKTLEPGFSSPIGVAVSRAKQ